VEAGGNLLVAKNKRAIVDGAEKMFHVKIENYNNPFGDGNAASQIVRRLEAMG